MADDLVDPQDAIDLASLIRSGLISPPLAIEKQFRGKRFSAVIRPDGRVDFNGKTFNSPSSAAIDAVRQAAPGRAFPNTNGWRWWQFKDAEGVFRELDFVRQKAVAMRSSAGPITSGVRAGISDHIRSLLVGYLDARQGAAFSGGHPLFSTAEQARQSLASSPPVAANAHLRVKFSLGQGNWSRVPWIAVMDDRETTSTQRGVYCVYLFREDCSAVYLTLNQGVTEPQSQRGSAEGKRWLRANAKRLRGLVGSLVEVGFRLDDEIDLASSSGLGADYEASTVAYKMYGRDSMPNDHQLLVDLAAVLDAYEVVVRENEASGDPVAIADVFGAFAAALEEARVSFGRSHVRVVRSFMASLVTKPLVILTGLSGSGKTQLAVKFGEWIGQQYLRVIPVRPDWTSPDPLFGYVDVLRPLSDDGRASWQVPPALEFMLLASRDVSHLYVLVLDEMNLAHVERYFADFLSGSESIQPVLPNLVKEGSDWRVSAEDPNPLPIPRNLIVVGTVNVDETTYMFSPKVLDRANSIEFRVLTADLPVEAVKPQIMPPASDLQIKSLLDVAIDDNWHVEHTSSDSEVFNSRLRSLHAILVRHGVEFGYRTFYDAVRFCSIHTALGGAGWQEALDLQVMQKVLPRLHGGRRRLEPILAAVGRFCFDFSAEIEPPFDPLGPQPGTPVLENSFDKIQRMMTNLRANQFVSFTE
jgi:5-methylcytosine-specific restriction protein B